jgi:hypothetical protein
MVVQGKPVARRGRKARDLARDRPAADPGVINFFGRRGSIVKSTLARLSWALTVLASLALTVGAGMRWEW